MQERNSEIGPKNTEYNVKWFRLGKRLGELEEVICSTNVELTTKASLVNMGMRDRWTIASASNVMESHSTVWRLFHQQI